MGKQRNIYFIGRQENIVYYQWKGGYYMRTKSTLDGKRFWQDPAFAGSRKRAVEFGEAAKLASEVYQLLPAELRKRGVIGKLTGLAHKALMHGKNKDVVMLELLEACGLRCPSTLQPAKRGCTAGVNWNQSDGLSNKLIDEWIRPKTNAKIVLNELSIRLLDTVQKE